MSHHPDDPWLQQIRRQLDDSNESLDYATQLKLQKAREAALNQSMASSHQQKQSHWLRIALPTFATTAVVAVFTLSSLTSLSPEESTESLLFQDIELLAIEEDLELIEQLEFYEWLESDASEVSES